MEKKYDHLTHEKNIQSFWEQNKTYQIKPELGKLYSIDTPPPTVSGTLHIGHIFSYTQTDIIARYKRLRGFQVFYPFGFDDNGLPTERYVEKKLNVNAHELGRSAFIKLCLEETKKVEQEFKDLWQRMGLSVDWNMLYSTISPEARKISQESFILLYKKDYIYRQYEPALYCTTCRTSVAQAELDDIEKASSFNDVVFKGTDGELIVGTTRPELLSSTIALLYHPKDKRYQHLKGMKAIVPVFNQEIPIYEDESVEIEKGTGLVMVSTFGDKNDIQWYKKFKLPYKPSIGPDGKWMEGTGILKGLKVKQARERIIDELKKQGLLKNQKPITHTVNVHERCKKEIEIIALSQWFLKILEFKKKFLEQAEKVHWFPTFMKARYANWVENIAWDWCLSRQRFYGIPFPVWHCANGHILLADIKDLPIDPQETPYPGKTCAECKTDDITPDTDVMDTWNTSSLTPQLCFNLFDDGKHSPFDKKAIKDFIPMSMRPQAHDIIRTWAFYTIVKSWMHFDLIPWKDIVISGHVLTETKEKLSKSLAEQKKIAPEQLLKQYSADAIRYWTAAGSLGQDVAFSEHQLKIGKRLITKIWNAFRFVGEHIDTKEKVPKELSTINEWILTKSSECLQTYIKYLDEYQFNLALDTIERFFWHDFCDNYLELIKNQLFNPEQYTKEEVKATQWTLYTIGFRILQLYAPFLPHITETIYKQLYEPYEKVNSIHVTVFDPEVYLFTNSTQLMEHLINLISQVRKLKTEQQLSLKTELNELIIYANDQKLLDAIKQEEQLIKGVTQAQAITYKKEKLESPKLKEVNGKWVAVVGG